MAIPTVQEIEDGKTDLDDLESIVNGSTTVTTRLGGDKLSVDQALSRIIHGDITAYSAASTYTLITDWVTESGVVYRPIPSYLPIGPETFNSAKWVAVAGSADAALTEGTFNGVVMYVEDWINRSTQTNYTTLIAAHATQSYAAGDVVTLTDVGIAGQGTIVYSVGHGITSTVGANARLDDDYYWRRDYSGQINSRWWGDTGADINLALAYASSIGAASVFTPAGSYTTSVTVLVPTKVTWFGEGKNSTLILQSALNTPSIIVSTAPSCEYATIRDIGVRYYMDSIGGSSQVGFKFVETRRSTIRDCSVDNLNQSVSNYSGIGILWDMEDDTDSYTNRAINNTVLGSTYGLWSKGPLTSSVISYNQFKTKNGIRLDRESTQGGNTAIVGNQIHSNLIQSHSTATHGTGNGIDFGQADSGLGFTYAFSNQIGPNYMEQFLNGILFRSGANNNDVASQDWDNCTNETVDLNTDGSGYSGFNAQSFEIITKDQIFQVTGSGLKQTSKVTDAVSYGGALQEKTFTANGETITTLNYSVVEINGGGANRTGALLSRASAIQGQRITLIGVSADTVSLSTTGLILNNNANFNIGTNVGNVALVEFEYNTSLNSWIERTRCTVA